MQSSLVLQNLLSPPVLFFFLGVLAVLFKSDLDIPSPLPKLFSLYLLMAIGFKGGIELAYSGLGSEVLLTIGAAIFMALAVPLLCFYVLRLKLDAANAAAVAASYGSISAVTFSLVIGALVGSFNAAGVEKMVPFTEKLFYGALCFFLLDMGLVAAQRLQDLRQVGSFLIGFAVLAPLVNAMLGLGISRLLGLPQGDALLFMVLCASASYIAVPAAMRMTVPEANPSLYISTALGLTFPFNVVVGIPLYLTLVQRFIPAR